MEPSKSQPPYALGKGTIKKQDSSLVRHIGQALTTITLRQRKLSIVSIPPSSAIHPNNITLGGVFMLHKLPQKEWLSSTSIGIEEEEATEKKPSEEAIQIHLSLPSLGMKTLVRNIVWNWELGRLHIFQIPFKSRPLIDMVAFPLHVVVNFSFLVISTMEQLWKSRGQRVFPNPKINAAHS